MSGLSGKMEYLGIDKVPAKSTFIEGLRKRSDRFFEALYSNLVKEFSSFLSDDSEK